MRIRKQLRKLQEMDSSGRSNTKQAVSKFEQARLCRPLPPSLPHDLPPSLMTSLMTS